jgi:hypothetical protein
LFLLTSGNWHGYCINYIEPPPERADALVNQAEGFVMIGMLFRVYCLAVVATVITVTWSPIAIAG